MRDPKRIDRVIGLLRSYWHANPDLRLGQIIVNLTPPEHTRQVLIDRIRGPEGQLMMDVIDAQRDPYFVEDEAWEKTLGDELIKLAKEYK